MISPSPQTQRFVTANDAIRASSSAPPTQRRSLTLGLDTALPENCPMNRNCHDSFLASHRSHPNPRPSNGKRGNGTPVNERLMIRSRMRADRPVLVRAAHTRPPRGGRRAASAATGWAAPPASRTPEGYQRIRSLGHQFQDAPGAVFLNPAGFPPPYELTKTYGVF
jgi:hypothetical protein